MTAPRDVAEHARDLAESAKILNASVTVPPSFLLAMADEIVRLRAEVETGCTLDLECPCCGRDVLFPAELTPTVTGGLREHCECGATVETRLDDWGNADCEVICDTCGHHGAESGWEDDAGNVVEGLYCSEECVNGD